MRVGDSLDLVEFVMADGAVADGGHPSRGGSPGPALSLDPDEHIVRLEVGQGGSLDRLRVVTSKGREALWRGNFDQAGRSPESYVASAEDPIVAFERGGGGSCPRITRVLRLSHRADKAAAARG